MVKAWLIYALLRLAIFFAALAVFMLLNLEPWIAAFLAAVVSLALSILLLGKQRAAMSAAIFERSQRVKKVEVEDRLLDESREQN